MSEPETLGEIAIVLNRVEASLNRLSDNLPLSYTSMGLFQMQNEANARRFSAMGREIGELRASQGRVSWPSVASGITSIIAVAFVVIERMVS